MSNVVKTKDNIAYSLSNSGVFVMHVQGYGTSGVSQYGLSFPCLNATTEQIVEAMSNGAMIFYEDENAFATEVKDGYIFFGKEVICIGKEFASKE